MALSVDSTDKTKAPPLFHQERISFEKTEHISRSHSTTQAAMKKSTTFVGGHHLLLSPGISQLHQ